MKLNKFFILTAAVAALSSCRPDLLDTTPFDKASSGSMWANENLCTMGVNAIYSSFHSNSVAKEVWKWEAFGTTGFCRDNDYPLLAGTASESGGDFANYWKEHYAGIYKANDAIVHLPEASIDEKMKGRLLAEAKILRAFFYYKLNMVFKGVPYYDTPFELEDAKKARETEAKIWENCIKDLTEAIAEANLPERHNTESADWGRMNKSIAYAIRGKVYMWMKEWAKAEADFKQLGAMGHKLFEGEYKNLFKEANERSDEAILSMQCIDNQGEGYSNQLHFRYGGRNAMGQGWNTCVVSTDFADTYEFKDGTEFKWNEVLEGWDQLTPEEREIFFVRNSDKETLIQELKDMNFEGDDNLLNSTVETIIARTNSHLKKFSPKALAYYLPAGNEARLKKAYENRDPRMLQTMITPYSEVLGSWNKVDHNYISRWPFIADFQDVAFPFDLRTDTKTHFYYLFRKFVGEGSFEFSDRKTSPIDVPIIRYGACLINLAEALNEQGKTAEAIAELNKVRKRAGVAPLKSGLSQNEMRTRIQKEFRWETAGEGVDFYEELRWGTWKQSKFNNDDKNNPAGMKEAWGVVSYPLTWGGDYYNVWPIPKHEIDMNPELTQNPGW